MQINIQSNACILRIASDSIHARSIEHFVNKNFKRVLAFTNTRLIFPNKAESFKRSYFLKWAYQVYCKSNLPSKALEDKLKETGNIPIKIILTSKNKVTKKLSVTIKLVEESKILLQTAETNKQLSLYLQIRFSNAFVETLPSQTGIVIKIIDKATLAKLKSLLSSSFLMGLPVQFYFPNGRVDNVCIEEKEKDIIEDAFSVLGIPKDASMREIKLNYRRLLKQYHPDRVYMSDAQTVSTYTAKFQSIQHAFELIKEKSA